MHFGQVINATPHPLDVYDESGREVVLVLEASDVLARAGERSVRLSDTEIDGITIPIHGTSYGQVTGLPDARPGVFYVVALPVAIAAPERTDLLVCGPAVRDEANRMIGCKGLSVPHHPVAAHAEPRRLDQSQIAELIAAHTGTEYAGEHSPQLAQERAFELGLISKAEMELAH